MDRGPTLFNSAKFHHFDRHQGQTVAGLSSGISSARSQALNFLDMALVGGFHFCPPISVDKNLPLRLPQHFWLPSYILVLEEKAIRSYGIASIARFPIGAQPGFGRPCPEACWDQVWGAVHGGMTVPLCFFGIGKNGGFTKAT